MSFSVSIHYLQQGVLAETYFTALPEAEKFFAYQVQHSSPEPVEVWLKRQVNSFEEYLLDYRKLLGPPSKPLT